jgi:selenoprotein W-related protein
LAAEIKEETGVEASLIKGSNGVFDVVVDGKLIYSKHQTGRFPEPDEVIDRLPHTA